MNNNGLNCGAKHLNLGGSRAAYWLRLFAAAGFERAEPTAWKTLKNNLVYNSWAEFNSPSLSWTWSGISEEGKFAVAGSLIQIRLQTQREHRASLRPG